MSARVTRRARLLALLGVAGLVCAAAAPVSVAATVPPVPGLQSDTASAVDVQGSGALAGLTVHVNQTQDLVTQAVSVSWSWPGHPTKSARDPFGNGPYYANNFVRVMQCWGDPVTADTVAAASEPDRAVAEADFVDGNEGPPREQCEYGAVRYDRGVGNVSSPGQAQRRFGTATTTDTHFGDETAYQPSKVGLVTVNDIPFDGANGQAVPHPYVTTTDIPNFPTAWGNPFFDPTSTNEQPSGFINSDGVGGTLFQVQNSGDARGLGCGAERLAGGGLNRCWLVLVVQGDKDLDGSSIAVNAGGTAPGTAFQSPLNSSNFSQRIVVPLDFRPVQGACTSDLASHLTVGSPLVASAMFSWQARLCDTAGQVYNYSQGTDANSRSSLASDSTSMQFVTEPVPPDQTASPVTYAPVTLSALGIGFVYDRATFNSRTGVADGPQVPSINLNQRLVAKLLTQSYLLANPYRLNNAAEAEPPPSAYGWLARNKPTWLGDDPEFLALNPQLVAGLSKGTTLQPAGDLSYLQGPIFGSDAVSGLWKWVMADKDARSFMSGVPDPSGMTVDPYYSTNADINPTGYAFDTDIDDLPYADPWQGLPGSDTRQCDAQTTLFSSDIRPQAKDGLAGVAYDLLTVNSLERYRGGFLCQPLLGQVQAWQSARTSNVVVPGQRGLAGITDTGSANRYGVVFASLANNAPLDADGDKTYVAPTAESISAAAQTLVPTDVAGVSQPDPQSTSATAYPLAFVSYAGVTTNGMAASDCSAYATLLDYAATDGQTPGVGIGNLPPGYVPLPATLRAQTTAAAQTVAACAQVSEAPAAAPDEASPPTLDTATPDVGSDQAVDTGVVEQPAAATPSATTPVVSLASSQTKPDPSVFAYVVPVAALVGLLAVLAAPLAGLRRRKAG